MASTSIAPDPGLARGIASNPGMTPTAIAPDHGPARGAAPDFDSARSVRGPSDSGQRLVV
ncbi:hypothetical protein GCM10009556_104750 [Acrocarpospora pleiomorpha]